MSAQNQSIDHGGVERRASSVELEPDVARLIVSTLHLSVDPATIVPTAPLFGEGLGLDSIDALELSLAISKQYGYQIRSDDVEVRQVFSSLRALCTAIAAHRSK